MNREWAVAVALLAQLVIAFVPILTKFCQLEIDTNAVMFDRFWIGVLFFALWDGLVKVRRRLFDSPPVAPEAIEQKISATSLLGLLCLASFFLSGSTVIWAWSLTQTSIANATLMHSTLPLFTVLVGWLLLGQRFDGIFLVGMTFTMVGGFIVGLDDFQIGLDKLQGDLFALLSALFYTGYLLTVAKLRDQLNATTIVMRVSAICIVLNFPLLFMVQGRILPSSGNGWLAAIGLGLTLALGQGLMAYSLKQLSSGFVSLVACLDSILSASLGWLFFSEALSLYNFVGFGIILLGVCLTSYSQSAVKESELLDSNRVVDIVES